MYPYTGITFVIGCVIAYKLLRRLYAWNDAGIKRRDAERKGIELERAIREARQAAAFRAAAAPPANRNPITGTAGEWDHIPRIAFDLDTQREFGGSRYHTNVVSPEEAADFGIQPGVYITDKREGPTKIGESEQTRFFIPYDQLITAPSPTASDRLPGWVPAYCRDCGAPLGRTERFCGGCGRTLDW